MDSTGSQELLKKVAAKKNPEKADIRACLEQAHRLAIRVEAAKVVTGYLSDTLLDAVDGFLRLAVPFIAAFGDFELSTLLGALKLWLDKKKLEREKEEQERQRMQSQSFSDINFTYSF